jgi:hypothetical protein
VDPTDWIDAGSELLSRETKRLITVVLLTLSIVSTPMVVRMIQWYAHEKAASITREIQRVQPTPAHATAHP